MGKWEEFKLISNISVTYQCVFVCYILVGCVLAGSVVYVVHVATCKCGIQVSECVCVYSQTFLFCLFVLDVTTT